MDTETDPNIPSIDSKSSTFPLKHQEWVRKELRDLEEAEIIQRSLPPYAVPIVIVPQNVQQVHQCKRQRDCVFSIGSLVPNCPL